MTQKFLQFDEVIEQLGISREHLTQLRESNVLRAYRDGSSWKFRAEDIEKVLADGVPPMSAEDSSLDLDLGDLDLDDDQPLDFDLEDSPVATTPPVVPVVDDDQPLDLGDLEDLVIDLEDESLQSIDEPADLSSPALAALEVEEPTDVTKVESAPDPREEMSLGDDDAESILLSEVELGESDASPSTIIGRGALGHESDLDLAQPTKPTARQPASSDVRLADDIEDVLAGVSGGSGQGSAFDDLEELELDLEAESSRVLAPKDVAAAQAAARASASDLFLSDDEAADKPGSMSDLLLDPATSGSDLQLAGDSVAKGGSGSVGGLSALELDNEDDFVLGDGSDVTLSSADSGINLKPSDSGLALDEGPLAGSAIGSSLDLGEALKSRTAGESGGLLGDGGFELTPLTDRSEAEEEDSSQIIAIDEIEEPAQGEGMFGSELGGAAAAVIPAAAFASAPVSVTSTETPYPGWVLATMSICLLMMAVGGVAAIDLVRHMWSWDQPYTLSSSLIEGLTGLFF